ncbi:MAG: PQQ-binding-like beta-propeller repeat protein [Bacteroidales bacterium]
MSAETNNGVFGSNRLWNRIALVSGILALLICILLIANYVQLKKSDPVNMTVLSTLKERLAQEPGDSLLRKEIRVLDLLSRKAYFTSQWQIKTGGYFLLITVALAVIALQIIEYRKKINPLVSEPVADDLASQRARARKWIVSGGIVILAVAVLFAILASNDLDNKFADLAKGGDVIGKSAEPGLAVSQVTSASDSIPATTDSDVSKDTARAVLSISKSDDNYPNFRGEGGTGFSGKKNIPVSWDGPSGNGILWKTAIPLPGYNSPVIWGTKVFVTGSDGKSQEVFCFDITDGKLLWTVKIGTGNKAPVVSAETGYAPSTVATDGTGVYAIFPTGEIAAVDMNGKVLWERDLGMPENHYGHASSLLVYKGNVIVQFDQRVNPRVMALSCSTGKTTWSTDRQVKVSWSSPIIVNTGTRNELILVADPYVISYNPDNGKELWRLECITGEVGPSLTHSNGIVFSVNEYSKLSAIRAGDQPAVIWENNEYLSDIPSPVATDKYLFLATTYGLLVCYDARNGTKYWEKDLGSTVFSSPVVAEGKIYLLDRKGVMHIFLADKELSLVGEPNLGEESACTPAFTNGKILIRSESSLYCIGK